MAYDLFISYAHRDNARGQVRELRDAIADDFASFAGRELTVFFDENDIPSMVDWDKRIALGLRESRLFLAVVSPNYLASRYCRKEWDEYVRYEAMRQCLGEGVAPVYFIELPKSDEPGFEQGFAAWVAEMRRRQRCDLVTQKPVPIVPWHEAGKRALLDSEVARRLKVLKEQMAQRLVRADVAKRSPTNVYRHNPHFVGRVRELTLLREALNERGSMGVVGHKAGADPTVATAVHGVGGMGKTELALAYSHAFAWDYPGGRWILKCENTHSLDVALIQLAAPLQIEFSDAERKDAHLAGERVIGELRRRERSLLLLDNVTRADLLAPDSIMRFPPQGHVQVVATTRLGPAQIAGSPHDHIFVAVDELPTEDGLALVRIHQPESRFATAEDEAAARELVELLNGFTLVVETAAIYLGRHAGPGAISAYLALLRSDPLGTSELHAADPMVAVRRKEKLLVKVLETTLETLTPEQSHVLAVAALLPAEQIPLPWLRAVVAGLFPAMAPDAGTTGDNAWKSLADSMLSLRLLQTGDDIRVVRMHRLTQEVVRKRSQESMGAIEATLLAHVKTRAIHLEKQWYDKECQWELSPLEASGWLWMERGDKSGAYLANSAAFSLNFLAEYTRAEALFRAVLERNEGSMAPDDPDLGATLGNLGRLLERTGRFKEAEPFLRRSLEIAEECFGPDDPRVAAALGGLSAVLLQTDRHAEAEPLLRQAVRICENRGSRYTSPGIAAALHNLAVLLTNTNRTSVAEPLFRRALAIDEECLGENHPSIAVDLRDLAAVCRTANRLTEAERLLWRALDIEEKCFQHGHPDIANVLVSLSSVLVDLDRLDEGERLLRRALEIHEGSLGPRHPSTANTLRSLAAVLEKRGRRTDAEKMLRRALAILEEVLGVEHTKVANTLNDIGMLLKDANRPAEAEPLYRRALAIFERNLGANDPEVASVLSNLATALAQMGRSAEAEPLSRRSLAINERTFGPEHPKVATNLCNLGQLLQASGRLGEAEPMLRRALAIAKSSFGEVHTTVSIYLNNLAQLFQAKRQFAQAEPLLRRALEIDEQLWGPEHTNVAIRLSNLTQLLLSTDRVGEAEPLIRRAIEIEEKNLDPRDPLIATSLSNFGDLLMRTKRYQEAESMFQRALSIDEHNLGPVHTLVASDLNFLSSLYIETGRFKDAGTLLQRAVAIDEQCLGAEHLEVAEKLSTLAYALLHDGRGQEAVKPARRAAEISLRCRPNPFLMTEDSKHFLSVYWNLLEQLGESEQAIQEKINGLIRSVTTGAT